MATPRIQNDGKPDGTAQAASGSTKPGAAKPGSSRSESSKSGSTACGPLSSGIPATAVVIDHPLRSRLATPAQDSEPQSELQATADYIAQLSFELARLAEGQKLTVLSYFLDMAAHEAAATAKTGVRG